MCRDVRRAMLSKAAETIPFLFARFGRCLLCVTNSFRVFPKHCQRYISCGLNGAAYICTFHQACPSGQAFRIDKQKLYSIVVVLTLVFAGVTLKKI